LNSSEFFEIKRIYESNLYIYDIDKEILKKCLILEIPFMILQLKTKEFVKIKPRKS
jgi:hypothetical protein